MNEKLAILGGLPYIAEPIKELSIFDNDIIGPIYDLLRNRPLSTLYGDYDVKQFENVFRRIVGSKFCAAVNSGTSALHSSTIALDISPEDGVLVTSFSFVATVSVIIQARAVPIFVDIDPTNLGISIDDIQRKITIKTKAVYIAHMFGIPADILRIKEFCEDNKLLLVEDCCQALGTIVNGTHVGNFGDVGYFSFNVSKIVQTGEGGMVITNEGKLDEMIRELRVNGMTPFEVERLGYNYRMTNLQALLGLYQIEKWDSILKKRKIRKDILERNLSGVEQLEYSRNNVTYSYYKYPFFIKRKYEKYMDAIVWAMKKEGVPTSSAYKLLYNIPYIKKAYYSFKCPIGEDMIPRLIAINPSHLISEADMQNIAGAIQKVIDNADDIVEQSKADNIF